MTLRLYLEQSTKASAWVAWFSETLLIKQLQNEAMESLTMKYTRNTFSFTCLLMQKNPGKRMLCFYYSNQKMNFDHFPSLENRFLAKNAKTSKASYP